MTVTQLIITGSVLFMSLTVALIFWLDNRQHTKPKPKPRTPKTTRRVKSPLTSTNPVKPRPGHVRRTVEDYQAAGPYRLKCTPSGRVTERNRLYFDRIVAHLGEHHEEEFDVLVLLVDGWGKGQKRPSDAWFVMSCIRAGWLVPAVNVIPLGQAVREATRQIDPMRE